MQTATAYGVLFRDDGAHAGRRRIAFTVRCTGFRSTPRCRRCIEFFCRRFLAACQSKTRAHCCFLGARRIGFRLSAYLLFSIVGALDGRRARRATQWALCLLGAGGVITSWLVTPAHALALGVGIAAWLGLVALVVALRSAWRGDRLAWRAVFGVLFMLVAMLALSWIALRRGQCPGNCTPSVRWRARLTW